MGERKYSKGSAFGKAVLHELVAEIDEGDGCRFDKGGPRITHKGLVKHPKYDQGRVRHDYQLDHHEMEY